MIGATIDKEEPRMDDRLTYEDLHGFDTLDDPLVELCPECGHIAAGTCTPSQILLYCPQWTCEIEHDLAASC
jgi:hypothetical protein